MHTMRDAENDAKLTISVQINAYLILVSYIFLKFA